MRVLAAWACADVKLDDIEHPDAVKKIAKLAGVSLNDVRKLLRRVLATGCLIDGDVSEWADRILQERVRTGVKGKGWKS